MAIPAGEIIIHKRRNILAAAATVLVLIGLSVFAWRVFHYASLIQSGTLTQEDLNFSKKYTASAAISSAPIPDGEFDVATTDDPSLGGKDAALTIVEFADFGCPYSREESLIVRAAAATYGDKVRFVYRDFPITELHPDAFNAAEAAECAAEQGKFWEYHDKLYANQSDLSEDALLRYATEVNLNAGEFKRCLASDRNVPEIQADIDAGIAAGVRGTPTFFLNGIRVTGAIPSATLTQLIDRFTAENL